MQTARRAARYLASSRVRDSKTTVSLVLLLALAVFAAGCGGNEQTQDGSVKDQSVAEETTSVPSTEQTTTNAQAQKGDVKVQEKGVEDGGPGQEFTLDIEGDQGIGFSGVCTVGGEEQELNGQVPASFVYNLQGQQLECQIRSVDGGNLKVSLTGPGNNIVQQTNGGTINLTLASNGTSSSTSSSGSSNSVRQVVNQSSSSSTSFR